MSEKGLRRFAGFVFVLFLMFVSALQATGDGRYTWFTNALGIAWLGATMALMIAAMLPREPDA